MDRVGINYRVNGWLPCDEHVFHNHTLVLSEGLAVHITEGEKVTLSYAEVQRQWP